ncbi:MAG: oligopeptide ABC transporter ATP-binding protein [Spirochaetes bacterium]|nr:MAG: oligopeptide ABC transporter ATP-binding protein [Spirochaetota bacterium]
MNRKEILHVENLKKYFKIKKGLLGYLKKSDQEYIHAVDDISFSVGEQEVLGFIGESGCGKSTMSRVLLRLIEPTSGTIIFDGVDLLSLDKEDLRKHRRFMQMIFQDPFGSLNPRRTVSDTLRQTVRTHHLAATIAEEDKLIRQAMEEVELVPVEEYWDKYPALLSGGQQQRVSMGRVIILHPKFVIADEPVSMLDVSVRIGILELLEKIKQKYTISFIYITHDLSTARYICDRIAIMYLGKLVEIGPTEEILAHPVHPYTKALIAAVPEIDPTVKVKDVPIKGYVPVVPGESSNCRFFPRCPYAFEKCSTDSPVMQKIGKDHFAACFRVEEAL